MKITLCGSARFEEDYKEWNKRLSLDGHTVYSLAVFPSDQGSKDWYTQEQKEILDKVHFDKIENSDAIFVVGSGYIGDSTKRELAFATGLGKKVFYQWQSCPYKGCFSRLTNHPPCALCYE